VVSDLCPVVGGAVAISAVPHAEAPNTSRLMLFGQVECSLGTLATELTPHVTLSDTQVHTT